ncbi:MAG: prepilin peptidase [Oscillospiraceae bacterium]|nr:prepilin peptidase [Oscillospiraceae bacterium]
METAIVYIFFAIFGACIGSFINVVISRLPQKGSFFRSRRSTCPTCGEVIRLYDLVPIISYLILLGKCRHCKARICPRYPLVEAAGSLFAVACLFVFNLTLTALMVYIVTVILLAVSVIDLNTKQIPNPLIIALIPPAIASIWLLPDVTILSHIIGLFSIALPMLLITLIVKGAFGGGDIKLMAVCGFLLGWQFTLLAFFVALLLGGSAASFLLLTKRRNRKQHMVFGPALCVGITTALFFGSHLINWYLSLFWF